jgi:hypothetical protein
LILFGAEEQESKILGKKKEKRILSSVIMAPCKGAADANSDQAQSLKGKALMRPKGKRQQVVPEPSSSADLLDESPRPWKKWLRDAQPEIVHGDPDPEEPATVGAYQSGGNEGSGEACVHSVCCA